MLTSLTYPMFYSGVSTTDVIFAEQTKLADRLKDSSAI